VCVRVCEYLCVCARVCACVHVDVSVSMSMRLCVYACMCVLRQDRAATFVPCALYVDDANSSSTHAWAHMPLGGLQPALQAKPGSVHAQAAAARAGLLGFQSAAAAGCARKQAHAHAHNITRDAGTPVQAHAHTSMHACKRAGRVDAPFALTHP